MKHHALRSYVVAATVQKAMSAATPEMQLLSLSAHSELTECDGREGQCSCAYIVTASDCQANCCGTELLQDINVGSSSLCINHAVHHLEEKATGRQGFEEVGS